MPHDTRSAPRYLRTTDGAIDYQFYIDRGRRLRSDAFFKSSTATVRLVRQMWRGLVVPGPGRTGSDA